MRPRIVRIAAKDYVPNHWLGQQSLTVSFWINFVLLRAAIVGVEVLFLTRFVEGVSLEIIISSILIFVADLVIILWQFVGVIRSCDRYQSSYGSVSAVWGVYFGIVMGLLFAIVIVFIFVQNISVRRDKYSLSTLWERERTAKYALTLAEKGDYLYLKDIFELGVTKALKKLLQENSHVKGIVLASPGGNTFAGRGVARVIRDHGLNSYVFADCFSACTLAFIAGVKRTLGPNGRLGFHRYGLDADYQVPFVDIEEEQSTDREFFKLQNIKNAFLKKVFATSHSELWIPDRQELLEAGVVHKVDARLPVE